jgi:hypothetical protein
MSSMAEEHSRRALREFEFTQLLVQFLPGILGAEIVTDPRIKNLRADLMAVFPSGREGIIEAKGVTPNTQQRLADSVAQLRRYADVYRKQFPRKEAPELILAVPGTFSQEHFGFLYGSGIDRIIDGKALRAAGADPEFSSTLAEDEKAQPQSLRARARELLGRLNNTPPGRPEWATYQTLCGDILAFLLCPPLSNPIAELSNRTGVNRRDFVLPNYSTSDFWEYLRNYYEAHYIVVDAKNYVGNVKKKEVLQLANYLSAHGVGLFGVIICRNGGDRSAEITRREQWVTYRKMIVILNDDDLRQMISLRTSDTDPSDLLRQKLEDFRLGF